MSAHFLHHATAIATANAIAARTGVMPLVRDDGTKLPWRMSAVEPCSPYCPFVHDCESCEWRGGAV